LKSANNEYYDSWLPIYINEDNFEYNKQTILNSFSILKYGNSGKEEYDFKPKYIFEIIFKLLSQMVTNMKDSKVSYTYLRAFFQYILLYNKLSKLYPDDMNEYFNIDLKLNNNCYLNKSNLEDFIIFTLFDKFSFIENKLFKLKEIKKNKIALELFKEKESCDLESPQEFLQYLIDNHLYCKIAEIMKFEKNLFLYNGKMDRKIKRIICTSFKKFINNSDKNTREKLEKIIVENIKFYDHIEFEKFVNQKELNDESNEKMKGILNNLIFLLYIKKKINEKNFMKELENNFSIYLDINEPIKELNEIINNKDINFDKEIGNLDEISNKIIKIIKEILILDFNNIERANIIKEIYLLKSFYKPKTILFSRLFSDLFGDSSPNITNINSYKDTEEESFLFDKIIRMNNDNLKLLYLYSYERLKKSINRKNNNLSVIESMFIKISLNDNVDENYEWYNLICEKQKFDSENKKEFFDYNEFILENKNFISCFHDLIRLNKEILLDKLEIYDYNFPIFLPKLSQYIIGFANILLCRKGMKVKFYGKLDFILDLIKDYESLKKLVKIYDTQDIYLLTFYELLLLEKYKKINYGFLSSFKTQFLYDLQMKDTIKNLKEKQSPKINKNNKKDKRISKKLYNRISKINKNKNKKDTFGVMKLSLWKTRVLLKTKKCNYYNNNYKY